jgi:hypothetical protein
MKEATIVAVTDWSNALVGPAAIDLYRVMELGKPGPSFLEAYSAVCPVEEVMEVQEVLLRLDAAVMLSLVYLSEAPDPHLALVAIGRIRQLAGRLSELLAS